MSYKVNESMLMAYLYGELSEEEREKVEAYLSEHEEARTTLEALRETQSILGKVKDREVDVPSFVFDETDKVVVSTTTLSMFWQRSLAIAASLALLILIGYVTRMNVSIGNQGMQLSFGDAPSQPTVDQEQLQEMIRQAVAEKNQSLDQRMGDLSQQVNLLATQETPAIDNKVIEKYLATLKEQNISIMSGLMETSNLAQKEYTDGVIRDFALFLDIQRQSDLDVIQTRFENLVDDTEWNQRQTNQILTNLLTTSNQPINQY